MSLEQKIQELVAQESLGILGDFNELQKRAREVLRYPHGISKTTLDRLQAIYQLGESVTEESVVPTTLLPEETNKVIEKPKPKGAQVQMERAERERRELGEEILKLLITKGPLTSKEIFDSGVARTQYKVSMALTHLKQNKQVYSRTDGFQGPTLWYEPGRPLTDKHLKEYLDNQDNGIIDISKVISYFNLGKIPGSRNGVERQLRSAVSNGMLTKRAGLYYKEKSNTLRTRENGRSKKQNFSGSGVATSGDQISSDKEVRALIRSIRNQGADVDSGGKHILVRYNGKTTTIGRTPGVQGLREDKSNLRAMGLNA